MFWDGFDVINAFLYAREGDWVNAGISLACGLPAVGNIVVGVAKAGKAVKAIKTAEKIAGVCRTVGKIGNTMAAAKGYGKGSCWEVSQPNQKGNEFFWFRAYEPEQRVCG